MVDRLADGMSELLTLGLSLVTRLIACLSFDSTPQGPLLSG